MIYEILNVMRLLSHNKWSKILHVRHLAGNFGSVLHSLNISAELFPKWDQLLIDYTKSLSKINLSYPYSQNN
jgi:hypothetical protein